MYVVDYTNIYKKVEQISDVILRFCCDLFICGKILGRFVIKNTYVIGQLFCHRVVLTL